MFGEEDEVDDTIVKKRKIDETEEERIPIHLKNPDENLNSLG